MIPTKKETNYLMDWNNPQDRINYFKNLRNFLLEVYKTCQHTGDNYAGARAIKVFEKWNVYFIDVDEIPRVNLDEPKE